MVTGKGEKKRGKEEKNGDFGKSGGSHQETD